MTKEELEKEVEEYLEKEHCKSVCTCDEIEECKKGIRIKCMSFNCRKELIVNFAEPREKRINHLEESLIDVSEKSVRQIAKLEKENAELKKKLKPENCLKLLAKEGYVKFTSDNINKAKELIKTLLLIVDNKVSQMEFQLCVADAKQFLKESEVEE